MEGVFSMSQKKYNKSKGIYIGLGPGRLWSHVFLLKNDFCVLLHASYRMCIDESFCYAFVASRCFSGLCGRHLCAKFGIFGAFVEETFVAKSFVASLMVFGHL